jgi:hypothetical protein
VAHSAFSGRIYEPAGRVRSVWLSQAGRLE